MWRGSSDRQNNQEDKTNIGRKSEANTGSSAVDRCAADDPSSPRKCARAVDSGLTMLYRSVGQRIRQDILKEKREIVSTLQTQLGGIWGEVRR